MNESLIVRGNSTSLSSGLVGPCFIFLIQLMLPILDTGSLGSSPSTVWLYTFSFAPSDHWPMLILSVAGRLGLFPANLS